MDVSFSNERIRYQTHPGDLLAVEVSTSASSSAQSVPQSDPQLEASISTACAFSDTA